LNRPRSFIPRGTDLIRQLIACVVVLVAAALAYVFFVPGAPETLARAGISLPFGPQTETQTATAPQSLGAGRPVGGPSAGPGGPGGPGGGRPGFSRQTNVVTTPVTLSTINDSLNAIGEGTAVNSVTVIATAAGNLDEVLVTAGQTVNAGDIIARFESTTEQVAYDRAALAAQDTSNTVARTKGLASSSIVANTTLTAAELASSNAELELRNAKAALDRRTVTSPISGAVGLIRVTSGNYVPALTTITTIDDTSSILIDFWVPERYATAISPGMTVKVSAVAVPGQVFEGIVSAVDNRIDPASRTLQVQAKIPNDNSQLRAGMSFSVSLAFPGEQYPTVNPLAILWSAQGSYVWKYDNGKATKVLAEIVQRNSDGVLVRGDLKPGDAIITEGILQLAEGAAVTLLDGPDGSENQTSPAEPAPAPDARPRSN
jgi:RND family efflux transporter MFP subunit